MLTAGSTKLSVDVCVLCELTCSLILLINTNNISLLRPADLVMLFSEMDAIFRLRLLRYVVSCSSAQHSTYKAVMSGSGVFCSCMFGFCMFRSCMSRTVCVVPVCVVPVRVVLYVSGSCIPGSLLLGDVLVL